MLELIIVIVLVIAIIYFGFHVAAKLIGIIIPVAILGGLGYVLYRVIQHFNNTPKP